MGFQVFDETAYWNNPLAFDSSNYNVPQVGYVSQPVPARVDDVYITNTDTVDHYVLMGGNYGGHFYTQAVILVPAGSGTGIIPPVDLIPTTAPALFQGFVIDPYDQPSFVVNEPITSGKFVLMLVCVGFC